MQVPSWRQGDELQAVDVEAFHVRCRVYDMSRTKRKSVWNKLWLATLGYIKRSPFKAEMSALKKCTSFRLLVAWSFFVC